jgi:curved DNA-binding protein CbpA
VSLLASSLPTEPTHYQCLGLSEDCTATELEIAWLRTVPALPPPLTPLERRDLPADRGDARRAESLRLAYAVLADPARRVVYDAWLARERAAPKTWINRLLRRG